MLSLKDAVESTNKGIVVMEDKRVAYLNGMYKLNYDNIVNTLSAYIKHSSNNGKSSLGVEFNSSSLAKPSDCSDPLHVAMDSDNDRIIERTYGLADYSGDTGSGGIELTKSTAHTECMRKLVDDISDEYANAGYSCKVSQHNSFVSIIISWGEEEE